MMPDRKPTPSEQLDIDRAAAAARSEAKFYALTENYPTGHESRRDSFVRTESKKTAKELEKRQIDVIPDSDRRRRG